MIIIVITLVIFILFLVLLYIRSFWLHKLKTLWNEKSYIVALGETNSAKNLYKFFNSIYSFNKMMFCFWKWNLDKMVEDRQTYNYVKQQFKETK